MKTSIGTFNSIDDEDSSPAPVEEQRTKETNERLHPQEDLSHGDEGIDDPASQESPDH